MKIKPRPFRGGSPPLLRSERRALRSVYCLTVSSQPFPHIFQSLQRHCRQLSIGLRTYVEQKIRTHAGCLHKITYKSPAVFIVSILYLISPHAVHCLTRLKRQTAYSVLTAISGSILSWHIALKNLYVFPRKRWTVVIVADKTPRLKVMYKGILFGKLPVKWLLIFFMIPPPVEPDCSHRSVIGKQFGKLAIHEFIIGTPVVYKRIAPRGSSGSAKRVVLTSPVKMRIIKMQFYILSNALI